MSKFTIDLEDSYDDFGFSAVSEDDLKSLERELQQKVQEKEHELSLTSKEYKDKLESLYKLIMPLLLNLAKDDDKSYIYWPDRSDKINKIISKVKNIMQD